MEQVAEQISLDDLDREIAKVDPGPAEARHRIAQEAIRAKMLTPEIAAARAQGMSLRQIADAVGCSIGTVSRYLKMAEMRDLVQVEARRIVRHMMRRDLGKEKYLALATSLSILIEKGELLSGNATERIETTGAAQTVIERINIAIFGARGIVSGESDVKGITGGNAEQGQPEIPQFIDLSPEPSREPAEGIQPPDVDGGGR